MPNATIHIVLHLLVLIIGAYLLLAFSGGNALTPPVASGVAFILIATSNLMRILRSR